MLSHPHRTLFVHIPKTAGQSIEIMFLRDLGLDWQDRDVLLLRPNSNPKVGPPGLAHMTREEYLVHFYATRAMLDDYYSCSIVRHPLTRAFSLYRYLGDCAEMSFEQWLTGIGLSRRWQRSYWFVRPQVDFVTDSAGATSIDFIGRFEDLPNAASRIASSAGLRDARLPHVNVSHFDLALRLRTDWRRALHPRVLRKRLTQSSSSHCTDPQPVWADMSDAAKAAMLARYGRDYVAFDYELEATTLPRSGT